MNSPVDLLKERMWSKPKRIKSPFLRWLLIIGIIIYFIIAGSTININVSRILGRGLEAGYSMLTAFLQPDFSSRGMYIIEGILESITMTVVATFSGIILSIPLFLGASKNISTITIYYLCRGILVVFRSLHVVILAILFVIMFGFGPFAGVLTMIVNCIGFLGKLLAEDIEDINEETLEAVRATGASWPQLISFGVWPQISARFIGLSIYRLDMSFRQSTVIGLVGAGGIGAVLETAIGRYDYNTASAILIVIIIMVLAGEYTSSSIRRRLV